MSSLLNKLLSCCCGNSLLSSHHSLSGGGESPLPTRDVGTQTSSRVMTITAAAAAATTAKSLLPPFNEVGSGNGQGATAAGGPSTEGVEKPDEVTRAAAAAEEVAVEMNDESGEDNFPLVLLGNASSQASPTAAANASSGSGNFKGCTPNGGGSSSGGGGKDYKISSNVLALSGDGSAYLCRLTHLANSSNNKGKDTATAATATTTTTTTTTQNSPAADPFLMGQAMTDSSRDILKSSGHLSFIDGGGSSYYTTMPKLAHTAREIMTFHSVFDVLPVVATVDEVIFCAHGGIPRLAEGEPDTRMALLHDVRAWQRARKTPLLQSVGERTPLQQMFTDLLWADPAWEQEEAKLNSRGFGPSRRGPGSVVYGAKAVDEFMSNYHLQYIIRAHECQDFGFQISKHGRVITVFSSSHYHGGSNNSGAVFISPIDRKLRFISRQGDEMSE